MYHLHVTLVVIEREMSRVECIIIVHHSINNCNHVIVRVTFGGLMPIITVMSL